MSETCCILYDNLSDLYELLIGSQGIRCLGHYGIVLNFCPDLVDRFTGFVLLGSCSISIGNDLLGSYLKIIFIDGGEFLDQSLVDTTGDRVLNEF